MPSARPHRRDGASAILALLVFAWGCRTAEIPQAATPPEAREGDAARLPDFDVEGSEQAASTEIERFKVPLGDAPVRGPKDAPVTIVMFTDFECPFCQRGHETLGRLHEHYPDKLRVAYKAYPLDIHSNALLAAMAARTAQAQGKFWKFHDLLYGQRGLEYPQLMAYAEKAGLDLEQLKRDLHSLEYGPEVQRDMRQARKLGVTSTPTFFINGRQISGAKPIEDFVQIIDEELALTKQWIAQGVAAGRIYEHATKEGFAEVVYSKPGRGLDPDRVFPVPIGDSPTQGPDTAPVTIVMFGDFECPFCARGHKTIETLHEAYKDRLRLVYKHNPLSFHSHAFVAARAAEAARVQGKFWKFHDALYELDADFDEDDLVRLAKKVGLNTQKFFKAMNGTELDSRIERDLGLAMSLGVTGTPAYFVNGRPIEGAQPELQFRLLIEEELERAAQARQRGIAPEAMYETLSHQPLE
jgi:protein-disulfide isomerase